MKKSFNFMIILVLLNFFLLDQLSLFLVPSRGQSYFQIFLFLESMYMFAVYKLVVGPSWWHAFQSDYYFEILRWTIWPVKTSDASELSSAWFSSDSARAGGFSAWLRSARNIFGLARLQRISQIRTKIGSVLSMIEKK